MSMRTYAEGQEFAQDSIGEMALFGSSDLWRVGNGSDDRHRAIIYSVDIPISGVDSCNSRQTAAKWSRWSLRILYEPVRCRRIRHWCSQMKYLEFSKVILVYRISCHYLPAKTYGARARRTLQRNLAGAFSCDPAQRCFMP